MPSDGVLIMEQAKKARPAQGHTPGPWEYQPNVTNFDGIGPVGSTAWICRIPENDANARLIAAAPETALERDHLREQRDDLLAAAEAMSVALSFNCNKRVGPALSTLRAAIARTKKGVE